MTNGNQFDAVALTAPPMHHFFGYYGIQCWNSNEEYVACLETDFHDYAPEADDIAGVGFVEVSTGKYHRLAETRAFNLQQGAMLHWFPGRSDRELTYNERQGDRHVSVVLDIHTGKKRVLPRPIAGISPDGRVAASLNYARLYSLRRVVGYAGLPDVYRDQTHPTDDGIYTMDIESGESNLAVSYQQIYEFLGRAPNMDADNVWFNHIVFNTDGSRFCFVVRWHEGKGFHTTLVSSDVDGGNLRRITDIDASHFAWRSRTEIIGWVDMGEGSHHHRIDDSSGEYEIIYRDQLDRNGHMSFTRDGRWMLTDTGPDERNLQDLYLWDMTEERKIMLGQFLSPEPFRSVIRCDLHPRWSRDEKRVCFDSIHEGTRQVYVIDVSDAIGA